MDTGNRSLARLSSIAIITAIALHPISLQAVETVPARRLVDLPIERRLQLTVGADDSARPTTMTASISITAGARMTHPVMFHHFRVEMLDAAGLALQCRKGWEVSILAGSTNLPFAANLATLATLARLNPDASDLSLPKPLGFRLESTDSILVVVALPDRAATPSEGVQLLVTIEYEEVEGRGNRLAVLPLRELGPSMENTSASLSSENPAERSWSWTADVSGRLLAMAGTSLEEARHLVLRDAATGEVLWRAVVERRGASNPAFVHPHQVVRLGVPVQAGRVYQLTATYDTPSGTGTMGVNGAVLAMALPNRTAER